MSALVTGPRAFRPFGRLHLSASIAGEMAIDSHRLAEERSIAYHRAIAARIARQPALLERARERVRAWLEESPPPRYALGWAEVLRRDRDSIRVFLTDPGERARELRQSSPFAGALSAAERWEIWRRIRREEVTLA